jgi:nuclear pore complex protein Nup62
VLAAEREQNDIDQSLDHIEQQQKDLGTALDAYEKSSQAILGGQGGSLRALDTGPADAERDKKSVFLATILCQHLLICWSVSEVIRLRPSCTHISMICPLRLHR